MRNGVGSGLGSQQWGSPPRGRRGAASGVSGECPEGAASWSVLASLAGPPGAQRPAPSGRGPGSGGEEGRAPNVSSPGCSYLPSPLSPPLVFLRLGDFLGFISTLPRTFCSAVVSTASKPFQRLLRSRVTVTAVFCRCHHHFLTSES